MLGSVQTDMETEKNAIVTKCALMDSGVPYDINRAF